MDLVQGRLGCYETLSLYDPVPQSSVRVGIKFVSGGPDLKR